MAKDAAARRIPGDSAELRAKDPVLSLSGVGPKRAEILNRIGIRTVADLLLHFPRAYEDRRCVTEIGDVAEGDTVTVIGEVVSARPIRLRRRQSLAVAEIEDASGSIKATWFGRGFLARAFKPGTRLVLTGQVGQYKGLALKNPDYEIVSDGERSDSFVGRLVPVYPLTEGLTQRMLRTWIGTALDAVGDSVRDVIPAPLREGAGFPDAGTALQAVHFPDDEVTAEHARQRFAYAELLTVQTAVLRERSRLQCSAGIAHPVTGPHLTALRKALPFELTPGQSEAIGAVLADLRAPRPMARLLQGDVGCGKTVVALHAIAACVDGGHQAALMAPTSVLAGQHYRTLREWLAPVRVEVALLTGSSDGSVRRDVEAARAQVVVGTHALFERATRFHRLGLVIVDEQHRFGVGQRDRLTGKGEAPDILHMTATPIPRSLALTVYGAMDLTVIPDMPAGRQPVETEIVAVADQAEVWEHVTAQACAGFQTYVVCPLVNSRETSSRSDVTTRFYELTMGPLRGLRCALLHGQLEAFEKETILHRFRAGEIDVLVSTTVVEVGVDAPGATTMVIENASTFGLSQLHQLRGRIGRNGHAAHCFLMNADPTPEGQQRLEVLCHTRDGFRIAEKDFRLRGPGTIHGTRQAGLSDLRAADLLRDVELLVKARHDAERWLERDPELRAQESGPLAAAMDGRGPVLY